MQDFQDGQTFTKDGVTYVRQGGAWHPQSAPVYGAPPKVEPYAAEDQSMQRAANARADEAARRADEAAARQSREFAATHNPDGSPKPAPKQAQAIPNAAAGGIQANLENLRSIDAAIAALDGRPQSIGPGTGALGDTFTQLNDPGGTDVRARVGQLGAVKVHDLSGAAVSASEAPRFQPFVPTVGDTPEVARKKLEQFREALKSQVKEALDYYGPQNGYTPYDTPQAKQFLQSIQTTGGTDTQGPGKHLTADQQSQFFNILQSSGPDAADAYLKQFGLSMASKADGAKPHSTAIDYSGADAQAQQRIDALKAQQGDTGVSAFRRGALDAVTLGAGDEIRAGAKAIDQSLQGNGSFGDNFNQNLSTEQGYQQQLQQEHPWATLGGQVVGSLALPTFGAGSAADLAKVGAGYGAAYGFNSGQGAAGRAMGALEGGAAGGAMGYAVPKGLEAAGRVKAALLGGKAPTEVPPLVDPATGELNQPMDAMRPADRVQTMKDYGLNTITPGMAGGRSARVVEQGMNNLPGSAGIMEDVNSAASGELRRSMQGVAQQFGSSKTLNEGGAELQKAAQARIQRGKDVISKAYNAIPISPDAPATVQNSVSTLQQLTGRFSSNPDLAQAMSDPKLGAYLKALQGGKLSWNDLKDFRSIIGEKIGDFRFGDGHSTSDLRALYAGLSEDMRNTAANMGPGALRAFERANNLNRQNEQIIDSALTRILGQNGQLQPEKAAATIQAMTKGGKSTGDLKTLAQIRAATVKSGAWDEIASTLIHLGGQPANSEGRAFQPATFVNWYADMSEPARQMLFKPELRKSLDGFVAMNQQLSRIKGLNNTSNSAPTMFGGSAVLTAAGAMYDPSLGAKMAGILAANYGSAKLWTNPKFVSLITGYGRAAASGNANAVKSQIGRFKALAATNPELREPLIALQQRLLSGANDNVTPSLAASQPNNGNDQNGQR